MNKIFASIFIFAIILSFSSNFLFALDITTCDANIINDVNNSCSLDINNSLDTNLDKDINAININSENGIPMYFFYSPSCPHCKNVENYFKEISKDYNLNIVAINKDENSDNVKFFTKVIESFNDNDFGVPVLVINNHIYHGDKSIIENLPKELNAYSENKYGLYVLEDNKKAVNIVTVTGLAFADSINPCELVVLLILLSSVLMKFNSKKKVLQYGLAFIITIYIVYFILGVGLIFGFKLLGSTINTNILYIILGSLAFILGALNLKDAISYGSFDFVMEVPRSWRPTMKKILESVSSVWSAIIIAIILSVFLLPCTAGPYVLISGLLSNYSWITILLWLVYYNIIFSLPMWIILFVVYFGLVKIDTLQRTRDKNIKKLHLIASILLILLALYLFYIVFF